MEDRIEVLEDIIYRYDTELIEIDDKLDKIWSRFSDLSLNLDGDNFKSEYFYDLMTLREMLEEVGYLVKELI